eukprot:scaffold55534_cov44-Attheya_sp.AAC.3
MMKKIDINQAIQDDHQDLTTKAIANLQKTIESQPETIADTAVSNDLCNDINELRDKIRDGDVASSTNKKFFITTIPKPTLTSSGKHRQ